MGEIKTRGGKRHGAGRKPEIAKETFTAQIRFPSEWRDKMGDNVSAFVRDCVKIRIEEKNEDKITTTGKRKGTAIMDALP